MRVLRAMTGYNDFCMVSHFALPRCAKPLRRWLKATRRTPLRCDLDRSRAVGAGKCLTSHPVTLTGIRCGSLPLGRA